MRIPRSRLVRGWDCDGSVTSGDIAFFWLTLFTTGTLGPSGLSCAGSVPCPTP